VTLAVTSSSGRGRWLFLRGLAREQRHFGAFPQRFAATLGVDVLCLDLPGFGTEADRVSPSTIDAIADDVRDRWGKAAGGSIGHRRRWSILGVSLGGMVALSWCARFATDFERCVVVNTSAADLSPPWHRLRPGSWPTVLRAFLQAPSARERALLALTVHGDAGDRGALAEAFAAYFLERPPSRRSAWRQLLAASTSSLPATVAVPTLVLASEADRLVSWRCSARIAAELGAPLHVHPTAGHDLPQDDPEWLCARVADSIERA
jgi:pimeloyl-ACP methyl ester carboxylesterase